MPHARAPARRRPRPLATCMQTSARPRGVPRLPAARPRRWGARANSRPGRAQRPPKRWRARARSLFGVRGHRWSKARDGHMVLSRSSRRTPALRAAARSARPLGAAAYGAGARTQRAADHTRGRVRLLIHAGMNSRAGVRPGPAWQARGGGRSSNGELAPGMLACSQISWNFKLAAQPCGSNDQPSCKRVGNVQRCRGGGHHGLARSAALISPGHAMNSSLERRLA